MQHDLIDEPTVWGMVAARAAATPDLVLLVGESGHLGPDHHLGVALADVDDRHPSLDAEQPRLQERLREHGLDGALHLVTDASDVPVVRGLARGDGQCHGCPPCVQA